ARRSRSFKASAGGRSTSGRRKCAGGDPSPPPRGSGAGWGGGGKPPFWAPGPPGRRPRAGKRKRDQDRSRPPYRTSFSPSPPLRGPGEEIPVNSLHQTVPLPEGHQRVALRPHPRGRGGRRVVHRRRLSLRRHLLFRQGQLAEVV